VTIHNIRHCVYRADDEYVVRHYDKTFDLDRIQEVDFVVAPFLEAPSLAHTLLSFGFDGGEYVSVSVEARREKDEKYSPVLGALRRFELMYVLADERDVCCGVPFIAARTCISIAPRRLRIKRATCLPIS
jgi:hypothetical protein